MTSTLLALAAFMPDPKIVAQPFDLSDVRLLGGPFETAHRATEKYLLTVDTNRLLAGFRINSGLPSKGEIYGGWETGGLAGHSLGHYLSACAQEYSHYGDKRFKAKADAIVDGLAECQQARPDGFLSAFNFNDGFNRKKLDAIWADVKAGKMRSGGFDLNGMWSPWYVHHKVLAGLLDVNSMCSSPKALQVAQKFADWAYDETKDLTPDQWQKMLGTEYGGMNDSLTELYVRTKNARDLELAQKFYDNRVLEPLSRGVDNLAGKHSNTQIPKIIGLARLYEVTGEEKDRKTAEFFWDAVVNHHTYVMGGNSNGEYLGTPDKLADKLTTNTCETCNTYNMLKLTRHLFEWHPDAKEMDFYERAYYNHILASQDPESGMVTYFVPLATNSFRRYSNPFYDFTCCHGSGMENHTKHGDTTYFHGGGSTLWVNLFMPTELHWKEAKTSLRQETSFPNGNRVTITILDGNRDFDMRLRHPGWARGPITYSVNGKAIAKSSTPSTYVSIKRKWRKGDRLEFSLPMSLHEETTPDDINKVALLYGPIVLAADMGPGSDRRAKQVSQSAVYRTPVLVPNDRPLNNWLKPIPGKPLAFQSVNAAKPADLTFAPFYSMTHERYGVYFDRFTTSQWDAKEAEYRAEEAHRKDLEARTIDSIMIGEMQPERDHHVSSERNDVRTQNDRGTRQPLPGGWFEFDLKVDPKEPVDLVVTYWGNERSRTDFGIFADKIKVASETLQSRPQNRFYEVVYSLPAEITSQKSTIRVRIEPSANNAGPIIAGATTVRRAK